MYTYTLHPDDRRTKAVLDAVKEFGEITREDIHTLTEIPISTLSRHITIMAQAKMISVRPGTKPGKGQGLRPDLIVAFDPVLHEDYMAVLQERSARAQGQKRVKSVQTTKGRTHNSYKPRAPQQKHAVVAPPAPRTEQEIKDKLRRKDAWKAQAELPLDIHMQLTVAGKTLSLSEADARLLYDHLGRIFANGG